MRAALFIVLSLAAVALAGPTLIKNPFESKQQQQYSTGAEQIKPTQTVEILKQWCFSSQMSQPELTSSFKKLVDAVKSSPTDQATESAIMSEQVCVNARNPMQKSTQSSDDNKQQQQQVEADAQAHELIKDVYMDALVACKSAKCTEQLLKIVQTNKVDSIRASYYMTRMIVADASSIKDEQEVKTFVEAFEQSAGREQSEAIERQKMLAATALVGKLIKQKEQQQQVPAEVKSIAKSLIVTIVERFVKPVSQADIQQYQQQQQINEQVIKKIAKRSAALKALANIPSWMIAECEQDDILIQLCQNKLELVTARQSAIECLEQSDKALETLKQLAFAQDEPIEVRIGAYRALMNVVYAPGTSQQQQKQQQVAEETLAKVVKHCADERNQQNDEQFVLYVVSHLDNVRTSKQPELAAIKECIAKNKQHYMQIQVLCKKLKEQLGDIRKSSRNYKLEQHFQQLDTGLIFEGDLIYESRSKLNSMSMNEGKQQQQAQMQMQLPKLVRVNMSMPVMGETVNVVELTLRQNQMNEELLGALKLAQKASAGISKEGVAKVVDSFRTTAGKASEAAEADLCVKIDGCTVLYLSADDFKTGGKGQKRDTRAIYQSASIVDELVEALKRKPIAFNRGFNFNLNERLAKLVDVDANVIAGLRFESRAKQHSAHESEVVARVEPRFSFEAIVGPAKAGSKKLMQRVSTKSALGMRLRYKKDELVDVQLDMPMNTMELFTFETQLVKRAARLAQMDEQEDYEQSSYASYTPYTYLPESIYGEEDIYGVAQGKLHSMEQGEFERQYAQRLGKRSLLGMGKEQDSYMDAAMRRVSSWTSAGKSGIAFARSFETSDEVARATGLRGKLRVVAAPRDMSLVLKAIVQKYEPQMEGYRVRVHKLAGAQQQQYEVLVSTPGSRIERTTRVQVLQVAGAQRSAIKLDIETPRSGATCLVELIHDGRHFGTKLELVAKRSGARHTAECGVVRGAQSGRVASASFKPYLSVESPLLKRPVQMQGVVSYTQSPKTVISYELKCPTTGDFVQGKVIVEAREVKSALAYRKRSMQTPLELAMQQDVTLTAELACQVQQHALKAHQMLEWDAARMALKTDSSVIYKGSRGEQQVRASCALDPVQQVVSVERKCAQQPRKDMRAQLVSDFRAPNGHSMSLEARFEGRRTQRALVAYKHKLEYTKIAANKFSCAMNVELVNTERAIDEKLGGSARVSLERHAKQVIAELSARDKIAKLELEFNSLANHSLVVVVKAPGFEHMHEQRVDARRARCACRTERNGRLIQKTLVEVNKEGAGECKLVVEVPSKACSIAAELTLESGRQSSIAVQSARFVGRTEFSIESQAFAHKLNPFKNNYKLKSSLKDLIKKDAYWLDSALNYADANKQRPSFIRFDSPIYRSEFEFEPREKLAKLALAARNRRSVNQLESVFMNKESLFDADFDEQALVGNKRQQSLVEMVNAFVGPHKLGNKLWMARSVFGLGSPIEQLKKEARRAIFEYADAERTHKHALEFAPAEERVAFALAHAPTRGAQTWTPMRASGELATSWTRPSRVSFASEPLDFEMDARPFDGEQAFAKLVATSRTRRSTPKKHEMEYRFDKHHGHKASLKHEDKHASRHALEFEADVEPTRGGKLAFESDKHGKGAFEYDWRKHVVKRSHDNEDAFANKLSFWREADDESHRGSLEWREPTKMAGRLAAPALLKTIKAAFEVHGNKYDTKYNKYDNKYNKYDKYDNTDDNDDLELDDNAEDFDADTGRVRRSILAANSIQARYSPIEYLKHIDARISSKGSRVHSNKPLSQLYNVDFDYQPQLGEARLSVLTPSELLHESALDFKPAQRSYKLASKMYDERAKQHVYELVAATKQRAPLVEGLASAEQAPVFVNTQHEMLEQPIESQLYSSLLGHPLKLDYSDKYGRLASLDYDNAPLVDARQMPTFYAGMRQKRAAIYFKDQNTGFEHDSALEFFPETRFGTVKSAYKARMPTDIALKTSTKYGPIVMRADSTDNNMLQLELESPIVRAKLTSQGAETKLVKLVVDNKKQSVELAKLVRKTPVLNECELAKQIARKFDQLERFEIQTEALVNIVESILKLKSRVALDERQLFQIEAELNKHQNKAYAKINGERVEGELVVDLIAKSANLALNVDDKRTMQHVTRLVRSSDKFYSLESITSYKSKPLCKLVAKISAMVFEDFAHLMRDSRRRDARQQHVSTLEAIVYEPNEIRILANYDCLKKEMRVECKNIDENKLQTTVIKFDDATKSFFVDARLNSARGQEYASKAKINVPTLIKQQQCHVRNNDQACQSELVYSDKSGYFATAKVVPNKYVAINTPTYKRVIDWVY